MTAALRWIEDHAAGVLAVAACVVTAVHLLTVGEYPSAWFDEIEILEMGRFSAFDVHPDWTVNLFVAADGSLAVPLPYFHYLSGALLEGLYRLTGDFLCGRVVMLLSLPACALALFAWLRNQSFSVAVALVTAALFLVDPNATICAHWYRPDLWCMALTFAALVLIGRSGACRRPEIVLFLSGALLAISVFFWITSVLLLPLAAFALLRTRERWLARTTWVAVGGLSASLVVLAPLFPYIPEIVNQYLTRSEIGSMGSAGAGLIEKAFVNAFDFVKIAMRSPFVWSTCLVGLWFGRRRWPYAVAFLWIVLFMIATRVYHLRMVYLMPWLFLFVAEAFRGGLSASCACIRRGTDAWSAIALVGAFGISVVLLNFAAWPEQNTLDAFADRLNRAVPGAAPRVYLMDMEHELYYAGRRLGWKMYSATPRTVILNGRHDDFLSSFDAVVVTAMGPRLTDGERTALARAGFSESSRFQMPAAATGLLKAKLATAVYAHGYPSCAIWTRK